MEEYQLIDSFVIYYQPGTSGESGDPWEPGKIFIDKSDTSVKVFINKKSPYNIICSMTPEQSLIDLSTRSNSRSAQADDLIFSMCDNSTLVKVKASNEYPYALIDTVTTNSPACGFNGGGGSSCSLNIKDVEVDEDVAEIIPEGFINASNLEYNFKDEEEWPSTGWSNSNLGVFSTAKKYWAFVREPATGCTAKKEFEIFAAGSTPLRIISVATVDELNEFSSDGQATITAESSFPPLEYSLNNMTWQDSNNFINLAPNNYTAYVRDTKQTKSQSFRILPFNPFLNTIPSVEVATGNVSRWSAVHNPLLFRFYRTDYNIVSIIPTPSSGPDRKPLLVIDSVPTGVVAGGYVVVRSQMYRGSYKVLSVNGTNIVLDAKFVDSQIATGYLITSSKNNYRMELKIVTGLYQEKEVSLGTFTSDTVGLVSCQIQSKLKNLVNNNNLFKYDRINWRDLNAAGSFELYYRELWDGNENPEFIKLPQAFYFTNSAKQYGDPLGSNMGDYVLFPTYPIGSSKAKFLTNFKTPTYFAGYPFDLSFIYSDAVLGLELFRRENLSDVNLEGLAMPTQTVMINQDGTALLNQDNTLVLIEEGYQGFVPISKAIGIHRLMLSNAVLPNMNYKEVEIGYNDVNGDYQSITETKRIKLNDDCRVNPVYLAWINTLGGWDYWLFETTQRVNLGTGNIKTYDIYVDDIKDVQGVTETISKDAADKVTVGATLDIDDFKTVRGVLYSPKVLLLTLQNPVKWLTVQVEQSSAPYETKDSQADLEFSIILPPINIQTN